MTATTPQTPTLMLSILELPAHVRRLVCHNTGVPTQDHMCSTRYMSIEKCLGPVNNSVLNSAWLKGVPYYALLLPWLHYFSDIFADIGMSIWVLRTMRTAKRTSI